MKIRQIFSIIWYLIKYGLKILYFLRRASKAKPNDDKIGQEADASTTETEVKDDASTYNSDKGSIALKAIEVYERDWCRSCEGCDKCTGCKGCDKF